MPSIVKMAVLEIIATLEKDWQLVAPQNLVIIWVVYYINALDI
jgi:hypothetical protein